MTWQTSRLTGSVLKIALRSNDTEANFADERGLALAEADNVAYITSDGLVEVSKADSDAVGDLRCQTGKGCLSWR
ncbi:unnamed protein product [Fusarium graminearum]|nr:unnamed protein product [Fusarium graminearum]